MQRMSSPQQWSDPYGRMLIFRHCSAACWTFSRRCTTVIPHGVRCSLFIRAIWQPTGFTRNSRQNGLKVLLHRKALPSQRDLPRDEEDNAKDFRIDSEALLLAKERRSNR